MCAVWQNLHWGDRKSLKTWISEHKRELDCTGNTWKANMVHWMKAIWTGKLTISVTGPAGGHSRGSKRVIKTMKTYNMDSVYL